VASRKADLVIAVSDADANEHRVMGAKKVVVIPNGTTPKKPSNKSISYWRNFKSEKNIEHMLTFIGSAHPPNLKGFLEMIGDDTSFLPKSAKIVLAGGVSDYLRSAYKFAYPGRHTFWKNIVLLGRINEDKLAGLIHESEVILLPITSGGGSNLKTAEAILSGKKVVSTKFAFRSLEKYTELPNLHIADTPQQFRLNIIECLNTGYVKRTVAQKKMAQEVQWRYCLEPMDLVLDDVSRTDLFAQAARLTRDYMRKLRLKNVARQLFGRLGLRI
jgi:hypothetical protein